MLRADFTDLPIGMKVGKGEIQVCPYCGRTGLAETVEGRTWYTHRQVTELNSEGIQCLVWEQCPVRKTPESAAPR